MRYFAGFIAVLWAILFVALFFGLMPSKLTIGLAFFNSIVYFAKDALAKGDGKHA